MKQTEKWYQLSGPEGDVVLSTRIRLARNLSGIPFPAQMTAEQKKEVSEKIRAAVPASMPLNYLDMHNMTRIDALSLVERHLISPEFSRCEEGSALLLSEDESVSLMLCEEDHLRMQVMRPGLRLEEAYEVADRLDTALDETLHFAFDDRLGYLTQCPTNLGTGMRAAKHRVEARTYHPRLVRRGQQVGGAYLSAVESGDARHFRAGGDGEPAQHRDADYP